MCYCYCYTPFIKKHFDIPNGQEEERNGAELIWPIYSVYSYQKHGQNVIVYLVLFNCLESVLIKSRMQSSEYEICSCIWWRNRECSFINSLVNSSEMKDSLGICGEEELQGNQIINYSLCSTRSLSLIPALFW